MDGLRSLVQTMQSCLNAGQGLCSACMPGQQHSPSLLRLLFGIASLYANRYASISAPLEMIVLPEVCLTQAGTLCVLRNS